MFPGKDVSEIRVYDLETRESSYIKNQSKVVAIAVSPDNTTLAAGDESGCINIWNVLTAEQCAPEFRAQSDWISSLVFSTSGDALVSASRSDYHVKLWRWADGECIAKTNGV